VLLLIVTIRVCYFIEIFVFRRPTRFSGDGTCAGSPHFRQSGMLYVAIGIIGATVMPTTFICIRSGTEPSVAEGRAVSSPGHPIQQQIDAIVALTIAFFSECSYLVLAATVFFARKATVGGGHLVSYSDSDGFASLI